MSLEVDLVPSLLRKYKHVQVSESSYAIETNEKTMTVFGKIMPFLGINAHLFIVTVMQPFTVQGLDHVKEWLRKHLPQE
jgi:energy-converting hydrogenase Eha subunit B